MLNTMSIPPGTCRCCNVITVHDVVIITWCKLFCTFFSSSCTSSSDTPLPLVLRRRGGAVGADDDTKMDVWTSMGSSTTTCVQRGYRCLLFVSPSKHETLDQCWVNVGLALKTMAQHWANVSCLLVKFIPAKHETSTQCWTNVGPAS